MSIATIVTRGYGTFGSVNLLPTRGYSIGEDVEEMVGPGTDYTATEERAEYTIYLSRTEYTINTTRTEYTLERL